MKRNSLDQEISKLNALFDYIDKEGFRGISPEESIDNIIKNMVNVVFENLNHEEDVTFRTGVYSQAKGVQLTDDGYVLCPNNSVSGLIDTYNRFSKGRGIAEADGSEVKDYRSLFYVRTAINGIHPLDVNFYISIPAYNLVLLKSRTGREFSPARIKYSKVEFSTGKKLTILSRQGREKNSIRIFTPGRLAHEELGDAFFRMMFYTTDSTGISGGDPIVCGSGALSGLHSGELNYKDLSGHAVPRYYGCTVRGVPQILKESGQALWRTYSRIIRENRIMRDSQNPRRSL